MNGIIWTQGGFPNNTWQGPLQNAVFNGLGTGESIAMLPVISNVYRTTDQALFAKKGEPVTIIGINLTPLVGVFFNGINVTAQVVLTTPTQIKLENLTVPVGSYIVTVENDIGTSNQFSFLIIDAINALNDFNPIDNHVERANSRILHQYKKPNLTAAETAVSKQLPKYIQGVYSEGVQEFEDAALTTVPKLNIDTNTGAALDLIGDIIGQPRNNQDDTLYKIFLNGRVALNSSNGKVSDIYKIYNAYALGAAIELIEVFPAGVKLESDTAPANSEYSAVINKSIDDALGAGIILVGIIIYDPTEAYELSSSPATIEVDAVHGLSETTQTTGGKVAGLF